MSKRLKNLLDYEIVIVCDDSGSMKTPILQSKRTRWDLLKDIVKIVLDIGVIYDTNGVDIYFLNQCPILRVKDPSTVEEIFSRTPRGFTPLVPILKSIFQLPATKHGHDKKLLVFVATDGVPTDENDRDNVAQLEELMIKYRQVETTFVHFLACTDDLRSVQFLNDWDRKMINVDVTQDYHSERDKILQCQGQNYRFSFGDYVVKALVGAIDPVIDALNESIEKN